MPKLGLMLSQLTPEAREQFELPENAEGVLVTEVQPGSPAAEKGLQRGDVIVQADRKQVSDPKAVAAAVREAADRGDETILLLVVREGQNRFVALGLSAPDEERVAPSRRRQRTGPASLSPNPCRLPGP